MKFTFKEWKGGYLHVIGNGKVQYYSVDNVKEIIRVFDEAEAAKAAKKAEVAPDVSP